MSSPLQQLRQHGIEIRHYIPGRLRFSIRQLHGDAALGGKIAADLADVPGITKVEYHPASTSVLVLFEPRKLANPANSGMLLSALQRLFPAVAADVWQTLWAGQR
jgi:hypothetical protein